VRFDPWERFSPCLIFSERLNGVVEEATSLQFVVGDDVAHLSDLILA